MSMHMGEVEIVVDPPVIPLFEAAPPSASELTVVPVPGVQGREGRQGETGPPGDRITVSATAPADPQVNDIWIPIPE